MVKIDKHSGIFTLWVTQQFPTNIRQAWDFFSRPENLDKITPPELKFDQTSEKGVKMYAGQIITYKINILPLLKTNWVTEITYVVENSYFIDMQRFGPYSFWHHEHIFKGLDNGVEMTDKVSYKLPLGIVGSLVHEIYVKKKLRDIFMFRFKKLEEIFSRR